VTIDDLLNAARAGVVRVSAREAASRHAEGALLVDTRNAERRRHDGVIAGSIVIDPNVVQWRLDPASPSRLGEVRDHSVMIVVICHEGFSSSLVVASLRQLGLSRATDIAGGFQSWLAEGLPTVAAGQLRLDEHGVLRVPVHGSLARLQTA
jgi:rhodanese-related sulfurtransferase